MHKTKSTCIQNSTVSCLPKLTLDVSKFVYILHAQMILKNDTEITKPKYIRDILFGPIYTFSMQIIDEKIC